MIFKHPFPGGLHGYFPAHKAHCSGHASRKDLEEIARSINPKVLIPVHTENAEAFRKVHFNVKIPEKGERMEI